MFYLTLPCIFFLAAALLPAAMEAIAASRERRHAPPPPPLRGFRPIVIQGGKQVAREAS
ncbi:MAG TPA: hypothetical protein VMH92_01065 [Acidocella sp.]|nr:hypothetical protein [Acidocella sp.]